MKEQYDANTKGGKRVGWDFKANPLDISHTKEKDIYHDYHNSDIREDISDLKMGTKWYNHAPWLVPIWGPIGVGIYNSKR